MPKYTPNSLLLESINGAIGDLVFYRDSEGRSIVQHKGERTAPLSDKQRAQNELFRVASAYGNHVKADPVLAAEYRLLCRGRMRPYHAAVRDFLTPPKVNAIDLQSFTGQPGQLIRIVATDDSRVVSVDVTIRHARTDAVLEQGTAAPSAHADEWLYPATTAIPRGTPVVVEATAADRPGNRTMEKMQFAAP